MRRAGSCGESRGQQGFRGARRLSLDGSSTSNAPVFEKSGEEAHAARQSISTAVHKEDHARQYLNTNHLCLVVRVEGKRI